MGGMKIPAPFVRILLTAVFTASLSITAHADVPDRNVTSLNGIYKVAASNDPFFPMGQGREWFMDFGTGMTTSTSSGTVTISLRQNPSVSVRPMVWQFFPSNSTIALGNQFERGASQAVAKGIWRVSQTQDGLTLDRGDVRFILFRPEPGDY